MSASLAPMLKLNVPPSLTLWSAIGLSTGGLFTSLTVTLKFFATLNAGEPLSVTRTVTE
jgi:hypothetical protein